MIKNRFALQYSIVAILTLWLTACSSGSGGYPAQAPGETSPSSSSPPATPPSESGLAVTITSPNAAAIETTDGQMKITGTANSDVGVSSVSWISNTGVTGTASGTSSWEIQSIPLEMGANTITVTATDAAGDTTTDEITISRESTVKGAATLSWVAPTQRTDGTPLTNLAGYTISYGRMSGVYDYTIDVPNPGITTYVVENLVPGEWYFSLKAYDATGLESELSNEALRQIQ